MEITKEYLERLFDYEDGNLIWKISPKYDIPVGSVAGYTRKDGYIVVGLSKKTYLLHRLIYIYHHGDAPEIIDHKDQNHTNNRIENLRPLDKRGNVYNTSKMWGHNTSGVRGVSWDKNKKKWIARFKKDGKYLYLGQFENIEDAIQKRKEMEKEVL